MSLRSPLIIVCVLAVLLLAVLGKLGVLPAFYSWMASLIVPTTN